MSTQIQADHFTSAIYTLLNEIFDNVHTAYQLGEIRQALCTVQAK